MDHYHLPIQFQRIVKDLYHRLAIFVQSPQWCTDLIQFQKGVFQGDPLSVTIFNMVMNLYVDTVTQPSFKSLAYTFSYANCNLILTQYADDTCLITNSVSSCQYLCRISDFFFRWAHMKVNVAKCRSLALSSRKLPYVFNPSLVIGDQTVPFIGSSVFKFLGLPFDIRLSDNVVKKTVVERLEYLCKTVDSLKIRRQQKLKIYRLYVCPSMSWLLGLLDLSISWVERHVDSLVTRFLKQWSGLAKPANPSILFLSVKDCGLGLPKPSTKLMTLVSCKLRRLLDSGDCVVRQLAVCESHHQLQIKNRKFVAAKFAVDSSLKDIERSILQQVENVDLDTLQQRTVQGSFFRSDFDQQQGWSRVIGHLPDAIFKWSVNAIVDTLPHNANLFRWRKSATDRCPLCSGRQTLLHVLNHCPIALNQGRFTWRHNEVLSLIRDFLDQHLLPNFELECDLQNCCYGFLLRTFFSTLRPDICIFNKEEKRIVLMELTVPFDELMTAAAHRKSTKYRDLVYNIQDAGYHVSLVTVEVGSRGVVSDSFFTFINDWTSTKGHESSSLFDSIRRKVICSSYAIWSRRNSDSWF